MRGRRTERHRLEVLARRMLDTGNYRWVRLNEPYSFNGLEGEYDLHGLRQSGVHVYVEEKGRHTAAGYYKALEQFDRARRAYPRRNWRFVYHTKGMTRLVSL